MRFRNSDSVRESQCLCVCLFVPLRNTHFPVSGRPLVEECIPYIGLWWHNFHKKREIFLLKIVLSQPSIRNTFFDQRSPQPLEEGALNCNTQTNWLIDNTQRHCNSMTESEFLKRTDTRTHVRAKFSRICAKIELLNAELANPALFHIFGTILQTNIKSYMFFKQIQCITLCKIWSC